ncbi:MAG: ATP-binding protein [Gammaproteobacteria bacterium]|nr:ATP-binding protein [Gammaproteobacteria bacterium]
MRFPADFCPRKNAASKAGFRLIQESLYLCADKLRLSETEKSEFFRAVGCPDFSAPPPSEPEDNIPEKPEQPPRPEFGHSIRHPSQFFGREALLRRIKHFWSRGRALQHIAFIGPRRSGKTSLLDYLRYAARVPREDLRPSQPQGWGDWLPESFQFVAVDFQKAEMCQADTLLCYILEQLGLGVPQPLDLVRFTQRLETAITRPAVILMDEIGAGLEADGLDAIFWNNLRALGNNCAGGKLGLAVTSHEDVDKLAHDCGKSSPFFNIFNTLKIGPLSETAASELVHSFFPDLPPDELAWLLDKSGQWPALLQLLSDERWYALETDAEEYDWKSAGLESIGRFRYLNEL